MKRTTIGMMFIAVLMVSLFAFNSEAAAVGSNVDISLVSMEPATAEPGSYVTLRFKIENSGFEPTGSIDLELVPQYPFSLEPGESAMRSIGTIPGRQTQNRAFTFDYKVRVASDAIDGMNEISIRWRTDGGSWAVEKFNVEVQTKRSSITIGDFKTVPEKIAPGEVVTLELVLDNPQHSYVRDVKVSLELFQIGMGPAGTMVYEELPFSPVGGSNVKHIARIDGRSSSIVKFDLRTDVDIISRNYKVPVVLTFSDVNGNTFNQTSLVTLTVNNEPDLVIGIDDTQIYKVGQTGTISVRFINKGEGDARYLYTKILPRDNYKILSSDDYYVGKVDADDYETATFRIFVEKGDNGYVTIPMEYEYRDSNNVRYTDTIDLKVKLLSDEEAKLVGLKQSNPTAGVLVVLAIVIIGYLIFRKSQKSKKKKLKDKKE